MFYQNFLIKLSTITCFDLWMSKGTYDIFALIINFLDEN
jgi:hypothetical protein